MLLLVNCTLLLFAVFAGALPVQDHAKDPAQLAVLLKGLADNPERFAELQSWKREGVSRRSTNSNPPP